MALMDFKALQYTIAMMGYAKEEETTVLELTYNYGVTEYTKGNAYAQVRAYHINNPSHGFWRLILLFDNQKLEFVLVDCTWHR